MEPDAEALRKYCLALQDVIECLVVELSETKILDVEKMCERIDFISAARRSGPNTNAVGVHMHQIAEILREKAANPPGLPPIPDDGRSS